MRSGSAPSTLPFLFALGLAAFAGSFATRAVDPMLTLVAADLQVTLERAALLASAFTLPYAATQLVFGPIGDAVGRVRVIRFTTIMLAVSLAACALAPSHEWLLAARIASGAWAGGVIPAAMATMGDRVPFDRRPAALSRLLMAIVLGQLSGSTVSGLISTALGWRAVFWVATGLSVVATIITFLLLKENTALQQFSWRALSWRSALQRYGVVFRNPLSIRLFAVAAVEGALIFGCFPFVAAHLMELQIGGALEAGIAIAAFGIGGFLYTFAVTRLVKLLGLSSMSGAGAVMVGLCFITISRVPNLYVLVPLFVLAGFCFYMIHNTLQILATELVPAARGSAVSTYATSFFGGQAIGAAITSQLVTFVGPSGLFVGAGIGLILLAWPASRLPLRVGNPPPPMPMGK